MAAPHATSLRALRALSQQYTSATTLYCRRRLHITGAFSAQPVDGTDKTTLYASRTLADLKAECERRSLRTAGTKAELIDRLINYDLLQSRAFSIARRRIDGNAFRGPSETRHINTSRASKAVKDTSTVDFVYFPSLREEPEDPYTLQPRMPIPPDAALSYSRSSAPTSSPMKPEIHAVSEIASDTSASPMTEVVDNHAMEIDPFRLTETVGRSRDGEHYQRQNGTRQAKQKGVIGELWSGMVEDLLGKGGEQARK
ncbi:hypothetical protein VTN49DRAFT_3030 [Thermomyces lanuginosus]|uniref:uncharacterized protein n=1 Tax=Thermomyces lanuginosus TaxID=5541 RepID=UPI0037441AC9